MTYTLFHGTMITDDPAARLTQLPILTVPGKDGQLDQHLTGALHCIPGDDLVLAAEKAVINTFASVAQMIVERDGTSFESELYKLCQTVGESLAKVGRESV